MFEEDLFSTGIVLTLSSLILPHTVLIRMASAASALHCCIHLLSICFQHYFKLVYLLRFTLYPDSKKITDTKKILSFLISDSAFHYLPCYFKVFSEANDFFIFSFGSHLAQLDAEKKSFWLLKFPKEIFTWFFSLYVMEVCTFFWKYFLCECFWNLLLSLLLFFINYPDISAILTIFDCLIWLEDTWQL